MKAVVVEQYDTIDNIPLKDVALPDAAAGQVRVKVQAASIGFVDGLKVQGLYQTKDALPFTPGTEFAGTVDAIGPGVTGLAAGQAVMGMARFRRARRIYRRAVSDAHRDPRRYRAG